MPAQAPQVSSQKRGESPLGGNWYGAVELRHHINTYYDADGFLARQSPFVHARLQLGAQFYSGFIDAYTTLGVYKAPDTQQVLQRRPEIAVDVYPLKNEYVTIQQYNIAQLPYRETRPDPESEETHAYGTVYTFGLAPSVKYPLRFGGLRVDMKLGLDGWTRLYSQPQYTDSYERQDLDEEEGDGRLGLAEGEVDEEPIEDSALHYRTLATSGFAFALDSAPSFTTELTANYQSRFEPVYTRTEDGTDHHYGADRYSYYKARINYAISDRLSFSNDFYHFFEGAFDAKRRGEERRYRNMARITCRL